MLWKDFYRIASPSSSSLTVNGGSVLGTVEFLGHQFPVPTSTGIQQNGPGNLMLSPTKIAVP